MSPKPDHVPSTDEPLILRLDEGLAAFAVVARLEARLARRVDETLLQDLYGLGRVGGIGHLPPHANLPAAPEIVDHESAIEYVHTVKERLRREPTLTQLFQ